LPDVLAGGLMQGDESSVGTRYGAFDEDEFLVGEDFGDLQALGGDFLVAVLSVHLLALEDPARGGALSDASGSAMPTVTVGSGLAVESVAFHDPGEAFSLGGPGDFDHFSFAEELDAETLPDFDLVDVFDFELTQETGWCLFAEMTLHRAVDLAFFDGIKTHLDLVASVLFQGFLLDHRDRAGFQNGDGDDCSVFFKNLGHADFTGQHSL